MWIWLIALALAADAPDARLYYESRPLMLTVKSSLTLPELRRATEHSLKEHGVRHYARLGSDAASEVRQLAEPELFATLLALQHGIVGAELDIISPDAEGNPVAVTVRWDAPDTLSWLRGPALGDLFPAGPTAQEIRSTHGVGTMVERGRRWDPTALGLLDRALTGLTPLERELVTGLAMHRAREPQADVRSGVSHSDGSTDLQAAYIEDTTGARVVLYDLALETSSRFVGPPTHPITESQFTLLHELGHAIALTGRRRALAEGLEAQGRSEVLLARYEPLRGEYERRHARHAARPTEEGRRELEAMEAELLNLSRDNDAAVARVSGAQRAMARHAVSPPAAELALIVAGSRPLTWYSALGPEEAFAEYFALHHADPEALARAQPAAAAWFTAGHHVVAARRAW